MELTCWRNSWCDARTTVGCSGANAGTIARGNECSVNRQWLRPRPARYIIPFSQQHLAGTRTSTSAGVLLPWVNLEKEWGRIMPDGQSQLCIDNPTLPQALQARLSSPLPSPRCDNHKRVAPRHVQACLGRKPTPCGVHQSTFSCGIALNLPTAAGIHQQRAGPAHGAL